MISAGHDFSDALRHVRKGGRAARAGWNGKNMWIALGREQSNVPAESFWNQHTREFAKGRPNEEADVLAYLIMKTADDKILMGWLASQSDLLADDWQLL